MSLGRRCFSNSLLRISSRTYEIAPPPFLLLSRENSLENPETKNCAFGKVPSSFFLVIKGMLRILKQFLSADQFCLSVNLCLNCL